jgi:hypothetical protein
MIQDQPAIRKVDSKICSFRFDCCAQAAPRRLLQQYRPESDDFGPAEKSSAHWGTPVAVSPLSQRQPVTDTRRGNHFAFTSRTLSPLRNPASLRAGRRCLL